MTVLKYCGSCKVFNIFSLIMAWTLNSPILIWFGCWLWSCGFLNHSLLSKPQLCGIIQHTELYNIVCKLEWLNSYSLLARQPLYDLAWYVNANSACFSWFQKLFFYHLWNPSTLLLQSLEFSPPSMHFHNKPFFVIHSATHLFLPSAVSMWTYFHLGG